MLHTLAPVGSAVANCGGGFTLSYVVMTGKSNRIDLIRGAWLLRTCGARLLSFVWGEAPLCISVAHQKEKNGIGLRQ